MSNSNADGGSENQWEDRGDIAWNEFDWERYLREQDEVIHRYLRFYEACPADSERIDAVAEKMEWGSEIWEDDDEADDADDEDDDDPDDVYTLHKNPVYISTKAIYLSLARSWSALAADSSRVPQPLALALLSSMHRGEEQAAQAIHALDFGDYAMAVSLFKRAMSVLNSSLALLNADTAARLPHVQAWREQALPRLFDVREVWLRVIAECRDELGRPADDES
jgi:hypothetical protein